MPEVRQDPLSAVRLIGTLVPVARIASTGGLV